MRTWSKGATYRFFPRQETLIRHLKRAGLSYRGAASELGVTYSQFAKALGGFSPLSPELRDQIHALLRRHGATPPETPVAAHCRAPRSRSEIVALIGATGLSIARVAELSGVPEERIRAFLWGDSPPPSHELNAIHKALVEFAQAHQVQIAEACRRSAEMALDSIEDA